MHVVARTALFLIAIFAACFASLSSAAEITLLKKGSMSLSGDLRPGDAEKFARKIALNATVRLVLDSPGGSIEEALRISSLLKSSYISTEVKKGGICASACFFIFLAGDNRFASGTIHGRFRKSAVAGYIGLHRPYLSADTFNAGPSTSMAVKAQHGVMQKVATYLRNENVPQRLIDEMMSRPSNDIYWMTSDDIDQLGEYSPGVEELLIARCGYSRKWGDEYAEASLNNDSRKMREIDAKMKAFEQCSLDARSDNIDANIRTMEKILGGWRPWADTTK